MKSVMKCRHRILNIFGVLKSDRVYQNGVLACTPNTSSQCQNTASNHPNPLSFFVRWLHSENLDRHSRRDTLHAPDPSRSLNKRVKTRPQWEQRLKGMPPSKIGQHYRDPLLSILMEQTTPEGLLSVVRKNADMVEQLHITAALVRLPKLPFQLIYNYASTTDSGSSTGMSSNRPQLFQQCTFEASGENHASNMQEPSSTIPPGSLPHGTRLEVPERSFQEGERETMHDESMTSMSQHPAAHLTACESATVGVKGESPDLQPNWAFMSQSFGAADTSSESIEHAAEMMPPAEDTGDVRSVDFEMDSEGNAVAIPAQITGSNWRDHQKKLSAAAFELWDMLKPFIPVMTLRQHVNVYWTFAKIGGDCLTHPMFDEMTERVVRRLRQDVPQFTHISVTLWALNKAGKGKSRSFNQVLQLATKVIDQCDVQALSTIAKAAALAELKDSKLSLMICRGLRAHNIKDMTSLNIVPLLWGLTHLGGADSRTLAALVAGLVPHIKTMPPAPLSLALEALSASKIIDSKVIQELKYLASDESHTLQKNKDAIKEYLDSVATGAQK